MPLLGCLAACEQAHESCEIEAGQELDHYKIGAAIAESGMASISAPQICGAAAR